jgi:TIR domain
MSIKLKPLVARLNQTTRMALESAAGLCVARTNYDVEIEHLLLKLFDVPECDLSFILTHFKIDRSRAISEVTRSLDKLKAGKAGGPQISPSLVEALVRAWVYASLEYNAKWIRSGFLMIGILAENELSRLIRDISPTLAQIDAAVLQRDFASIVDSSIEKETPAQIEEQAAEHLSGGPRIFISYRHEDGDFFADVLFDRLLASVPDVRVFRDTDTLQPGVLFSQKINETIYACDIVLALIGEKWLNITDHDGGRRLDRPDDWVRLEIAAALRHEKTVVPCLTGGARMPARSELPADLAGLEQRNAVILSQTVPRRETEELIRMIKNWRRVGKAQAH